MPLLQATGELTYNGYTFDGASHIEVQTDIILDDKQQTAIAHKHTITVRAVITAEGATTSTDLALTLIRQKLGEAGKRLKFAGKGFGNLVVGAPFPSRDVTGGPFPKVMSWAPIGDNRAVEITWTVEVTVGSCGTAAERSHGVMAINFGIDYSIDEHGDTTRTLSGYIEIARSSTSTDTADAYRRLFAPKPIKGFRRAQSWKVSEDRRRCTFTITDTQIPSPNPYPRWVTAIDGTHRTSWRVGKNGAKFFNSISVNISPKATVTPATAWNVFLNIVQDRLRFAKSRDRAPFITALEVEESLFGRGQSFSLDYYLMSSLTDFVGDVGLWRPVKDTNGRDTDWDLWSANLSDTTFNNRGNAGLKDIGTDNIVINLCTSQGAATVSPNNERRESQRKPISGTIRNEQPSAEKSWLEYQTSVEPTAEAPIIRHSPLQTPSASDSSGYNLYQSGVPGDTFQFDRDTGKISDIFQSGGTPRYSIRFRGSARRAGYNIARPKVQSVAGVPAVEITGRFLSKLDAVYFGQPVYRAAWDIVYAIPHGFQSLPLPVDRIT